ncbi:MAG: cupredoxin domain-containing protein [Meiothermus sp.]|nr:cupredoxin domain-containing protein [Meiothermus sp.]
MRQGWIVLMMLLGFALLFAACSGSGSNPNPGGGPTVACTVDAPSTAAYVPSSCTVKVGQAVKFTNISSHPLLPTGANPDNPIPNTVGTGKDTETVTFGKAGTYTFVCAFHPAMTGSITVTP